MRRARAHSRLKRAFTTGRERVEAELDARLRGSTRAIAQPLTVALIGAKGGVGRTLCTAGVGALVAERTPLRVLALDIGRRRGTLPLLLREPHRSDQDATSLLEALDNVNSATALRRFVSTHASGLDVLAGPVAADQLRPLVFFCQRFYDVLLLDTSGELGSSRVEAAVSCSRHLVAITTPEWPAVTLAAEALSGLNTVAGVVLNRVTDRVAAQPARDLLADRGRRTVWSLREDRQLAHMVSSGALGSAALNGATRIELLRIANGLLDGIALAAGERDAQGSGESFTERVE